MKGHLYPLRAVRCDKMNEADWLNDTAEQLQAEDKVWDAALQQQADQFEALAVAARAEIKAGITQPLFDDTGELIE
jgi:hypothetical protein